MKRLPIIAGLLLIVLGGSVATLHAAAVLDNRLTGHASPYLQLHADDPVHWQPWDHTALELAQRLNRPLFLSSGFYACHWCHVMQRESFRDPEVAALLNRHFIPVKLDREIDLATDEQLIAFLRSHRGIAGWPLNVFVTPEGRPWHGLVYQPRDTFLNTLQEARHQWQTSPETIREAAEGYARAAADQPQAAPERAAELRRRLTAAALAEADDFEGGFGDQSKFPRTPLLGALLALYGHAPELDAHLQLTLTQIATRGLRDHLAGGFFRYTEDPNWEVPHFEKMLYDNAQLAALYLRAAARLNEPRWQRIGEETLDFMLEQMARHDGGLRSALSAEDGDGVEGGYYLWRPDQLGRALGGELLPAAVRHFGLDRPPLFDHGHHLIPQRDAAAVAAALSIEPDQAAQSIETVRTRLRAARDQRSLPRDDKAVAAWNGLALSALALAPDQPHYREAGDHLARFITTRLWDGEQLLRALGPAGEPLGTGTLEDYAHTAAGLLDWAHRHNDTALATQAEQLADAAWERFHDTAGWHPEERPLLRYGGAVALPTDGYLPAPTAVLLELARVLGREPDGVWQQRAAAIERAALNHAGAAPLDHASHIARIQ